MRYERVPKAMDHAIRAGHAEEQHDHRARVMLIIFLVGLGTLLLFLVDTRGMGPSAAPPSSGLSTIVPVTDTLRSIVVVQTAAPTSTPPSASNVVPMDTALARSYNVLAQALAIDRDNRKALQTGFREGHVQPAASSAACTATPGGFRISTTERSLLATPGIQGGRLFVPGGFGSRSYHAFDPATGKHLWSVGLDDDGPSPAVCADSVIVFNTESCTLFVLEQATGKMRWSKWLGDPLMSTPMVANGKVFTSYPGASTSSMDGHSSRMRPSHPFACFDLRDGTLLWQVWLDGDVLSTAVADEGALYLCTFPGTVYKMDQASGRIEAAMALHATSVPAIMGDELFVTMRADADGLVRERIAVLDKRTLEVRRLFRSREAPYLDREIQAGSTLKQASMAYDAGNGFGGGAPASSGASLAEENIGASNVSSLQAFMGSTLIPFEDALYTVMGDSLFCLDPADGAVQWKLALGVDLRKLGGTAATAPVVTSAYVATATATGRVIVCDRRNGRITYEHELNAEVRYPPLLYAGRIYTPTAKGELVCIDTQDAHVDGWPMLLRSADHRCSR